MSTVAIELLFITLLVLTNGVLAGAEIAVIALRKTRARELVDEGRAGARAVLALRSDPERFLATVQVGITVIGATAAVFSGESLARQLAIAIERLPWIGPQAEAISLAVVVVALSFVSIVLGELVPKSLALRGAERYALLIGRPVRALSWLARPLVWLLGAAANLVLRPFGDSTTFTETRHSAEELRELVEEAASAGTIHPEAGEIAARALELPELTVGDVMVPRQVVVAISRRAPPDEVRRVLLEETHSRMPVYEDRIDNIVGYVSVKDMLSMAWEQQLIVLEDVMRPPYFVPESSRAVDLLKEMRRRHTPFAIVVDAGGGMSGIVTMEDLLEELVGEIFSEHARDMPPPIAPDPDGSVVLPGTTAVREVNRQLGTELPEDARWTTVAGLCLSVAGRIPRKGEVFTLASGATIEVVEATERRVLELRLVPPGGLSAPASPAGTPGKTSPPRPRSGSR